MWLKVSTVLHSEKEMMSLKMKRQLAVVAAVAGVAMLCAAMSVAGYGKVFKESLNDDGARLVGNWTGESICTGTRPACHDEKVVYRITKAPDATGKVTIEAYKIVNGQLEWMDTLDFHWDAEKGTLTNEFTRRTTHGRWELTVKGNMMEGVLLILPAREIGRRVKLKKDE